MVFHHLKWYGFSPNKMKALEHCFQVNAFSPECILKCVFKLLLLEKALGHWLQGNGFSPVCTFKCFFKLKLWEKSLGHWLQWCGFSPKCILKWFLKAPLWEKVLGHSLQESTSSTSYIEVFTPHILRWYFSYIEKNTHCFYLNI